MIISKLTAFAFLLFGAALCFGQSAKNAADFSGTWRLIKFDNVKVTADAKSRFADMTLKIEAGASEFRIERTTGSRSAQPETETFIFYGDGRGESNNLPPLALKTPRKTPFTTVISAPASYASKTVWDREKLVTRYDAARTVRQSGVEYTNGKYEWKLSENGKQLILTSSSLSESNNPSNSNELFGNNFQRRKIKYIFERVN
jgi:hypothetical protein